MRQRLIFTNSPVVSELYRCFEISHGALHHYTRADAAASILSNGELWLTRADSFLDQSEVDYGTSILKAAVKAILTGEDQARLLDLLAHMNGSLRKCYVLSLSSNSSSTYLTDTYGLSHLELRENFPIDLTYSARHCVLDGDGFLLHHFSQLYEAVEGYVVYDEDEQLRIAGKAVAAVQELAHANADVGDLFHMRQLLIACITLFKQKHYEQEEEYRIVLHRLGEIEVPDFDERRVANGRTISYIRAQVPWFERDCVIAVHAATSNAHHPVISADQ